MKGLRFRVFYRLPGSRAVYVCAGAPVGVETLDWWLPMMRARAPHIEYWAEVVR